MRMLNRGILNVPNVSFVDEDSSVRYLLENIPTHNGYEYVDLGLPSGLKWATCNVGAISPEEYGLYFAWGETTGYTAEQVEKGVRKFDSASYTAPSGSENLTPEQDAAHINMGDNWRMPTKAEFQELIDNCNVVWTVDYNGTGVKGRIFTSKVNENSVFFPAAGNCSKSSVVHVGSYGFYWSATRYGAVSLFSNLIIRKYLAVVGTMEVRYVVYSNNKIIYIQQAGYIHISSFYFVKCIEIYKFFTIFILT